MSLNCVFVIFPNQRLYPQFLISLAITRKKNPNSNNRMMNTKNIYMDFCCQLFISKQQWNAVNKGTPRVLSRDIRVKVLGFQRQGVFNTKLQQKMQTQWCPISNVQLLKKGRDMPTVRIMLTSTNGRFRKLCKISKTAGEWGQRLVPNSPISLIHLIHEADLHTR